MTKLMPIAQFHKSHGTAIQMANVSGVELIKVYDASSAPIQHRGAVSEPLTNAFSEKALVGSSSSIMIWGPYEKLDPSRYLVVYRFKFLEAVEGERVCFLDVAHKAVTSPKKRSPGLFPQASIAEIAMFKGVGGS